MFFKWFFKAFVAVFIVTHTFDITMAVFDMAQHIVSGAAGVIGGSTSIDVAAALSSMQAGLDAMEIPELLLLMLETSLVNLCMKIMSVLITVVLYGRMIEIYLYCSVSPIPFATMTNREWGQIGNNYLKGLFALGFQGFLIMICVGIYAVLVNNMVIADNLHTAIFSIAAYTVLLCFNLLKSGALAKSLFHVVSLDGKENIIESSEMYITLYIWPKYFSDYKIGLDFYDEANSIWEQVELTSDMELMNTDDLDDAFVEYILQLISDYQNEINKLIGIAEENLDIEIAQS